uniref:Uncharacterized protein n=1 Tax=Arion vulgaris TaxID=1028688 RepID=A0A0B6ZVE2_9EUPU
MSSNIKHEAVFPPAVFSLRRIAQPGPTMNTSKGSYELYDSQQKNVGSFGEKRVNGLAGSAPGSPGSMQDYKQVVVNLQRELEDSRRKGSELQHHRRLK